MTGTGDGPDPGADAPAGLDYDPETGAYVSEFAGSGVSPSLAVVRVMEVLTGRPVEELPPLGEAVDPEALDRIVAVPAGGETRDDRVVRFTYLDHDVRLSSAGLVRVRPPDDTDG